MYENFFGLKEKPFSILPDPDYLYWSQSHELAFAMLEYGLLNQVGFTVITGEVGCGKTSLLRFLLKELDEDVVVGMITNPPTDDAELLEWILVAFGEPTEGKSQPRLHDDLQKFMIRHYASGKCILLIVDEAQNLSMQSLERLRMLSNINVEKDTFLQLVLVGQPQLKELLRRPEMAQFAQRVGADFHLRPLDIDDTIGYVGHRLAIAGWAASHCFTFDAVRRIFEESGGVPRLINVICDTAMVYGFARNADIITAEIVEDVIQDKIDHGVFNFENSRMPYPLASGHAGQGGMLRPQRGTSASPGRGRLQRRTHGPRESIV